MGVALDRLRRRRGQRRGLDPWERVGLGDVEDLRDASFSHARNPATCVGEIPRAHAWWAISNVFVAE